MCGNGNIMGLSYPAWRHSWTVCGHSWTAYGWSWRSDQYNHSKLIGVTLTFWHISRYAYAYMCIYVYLLIIWVYLWVEGNSTLLIMLMRKSRSYKCGKWEWEFKKYLRGIHKKGIEYDPFINWYRFVIIISFIYQFIWTNEIVYCRNIGLSYEVNDTGLSPFRYQSMPIEAITPI